VLEGVKEEGANYDVFVRGLRTILGYLDGTHFSSILKLVGSVDSAELRDILIAYLARAGVGHEAEMGALFGEADIEVGLALVRVLSNMKTPAAREAISQAARSPHPVVRIEALGHVEGVSSERLRLELRALLEDREPAVRLAALKAMERYTIRVAGPFLVLRVRSEDFDSLTTDERRQAFQTLAALTSTRAESVALEVLNDRRLVSTDAHEASREMAAELLGRIGSTKETIAALQEMAGARLRNSDRVRAAAMRAVEAIDTRATEAAAAATRARSPKVAKAPGRNPRT
jgi:HEAT repeat protein